MTARYRAYARDLLRSNLGEIPDYSEISIQDRFNDVGGWTLTAPASSRAASLLTITGGIIVTRDNLDGTGPLAIFSGPITDYRLDAGTIEVTGSSDDLILAEKLGSPDPTVNAAPYGTEQDIRTGVASTVMIEYVQHNAGSLAVAARRVPGLTMGIDQGIGSTVYGQARWIPLLALMQQLALAGGGLRFQVLQSSIATNTVTFTVTEPIDRTESVVISRGRGSIGDWSKTQSRPSVTRVYVLGQGQGVNRQVVDVSDTTLSTRYGYEIETYQDRRDTSDNLTLLQAGQTTLEEGGEESIVGFTAIDVPSLVWGKDYDLGDIITARVEDGEGNIDALPEVIRGVDMRLTAPTESGSAAEITPVVSTPGDTADDPASRQQRAVSRRVGNLERNVDSLSAILAVQWNIGDLRMTTRSAAAAGWLLCDGSAYNRTTYSGLFSVVGTTYGAGDGVTTFNVPDMRDRFPVGKSGTKALGSTGGAATVDASHTHAATGLTMPNHSHAAGTLTVPNHSHAAGSLTGPSHTHTEGAHTHTEGAHTHSEGAHTHTGPSHTHGVSLLTGPSHTHGNGTLQAPNHAHTAGAIAIPNHSHSVGSLTGPSHSHTGASLTFSSGNNSANTTVRDDKTPADHNAAADPHTHTGTIGGSTGAAGTGGIGGSIGPDGGGGLATGTSNGQGNQDVIGAMAADGTGAIGGSNTDAAGTGATGSNAGAGTGSSAGAGTGSSAGAGTGSAGTGAVGGSTASDGTTTVTGATASDAGTGIGGSTATGGSTTLANIPPYVAINYEIYAAV